MYWVRSMKKLILFFLIFLFSVAGNAQVSVMATIGVTGPTSYTTLKDAFDAINVGTHKGQITINLTANTVETSSAQLNASGTGGSFYKKVTISPTVPGVSVSSNIAQSMIVFNGAANIKVIGNNNLTFINNNTGGNAISYSNDANRISIKNCIIKGTTASLNSGVIAFQSGVTNGNDNNLIDSCDIDGMSSAAICLYSAGSTGNTTIENSSDTVSNCNIFNNNQTTGNTYSIYLATGNTDWFIINNSFYQTVARACIVSGVFYGIYALATTDTDTHYISNNYLGGNSRGALGTLSLNGPTTGPSVYIGYVGMHIETGGPANSIINNTIRNISVAWWDLQSQQNYGIDVSNSGSSGNNIISGNTISNLNFSNYGMIIFRGIKAISSSTPSGTISPTISILNNSITIISTTRSFTGSGDNDFIDGISITTSNPSFLVKGNTISGITENGTNASTYVNGISAQSSANGSTALPFPRISIISNNINSLTNKPNIFPNSAFVIVGIQMDGASNTVDTLQISQNIINNFSYTRAEDLYPEVTGIKVDNGLFDISRNKIYDLRNSALGFNKIPVVDGINIRNSTGISTVSNNMITLGGYNSAVQYIGILNPITSASPIKVFYNSVNLSGAGGAHRSAALMRGNQFGFNFSITTPITYKNNIFIDLRTGYGSFTALTFQNTPINFSGDYNDLFNSTPTQLTSVGNTDMNFTMYQSTTAQDSNSISQPVSFIDTAHGDLHLAPPSSTNSSLHGLPVPGITIDFDGNPRSPTSPFMGASEGCPGSLITTQPTSANVCVGNAASFNIVVTGVSPVYQWQKSSDNGLTFNNIVGATSSTYTISTPTNSMNGNKFRVLISLPCGALYSNIVTLNVNPTNTWTGAAGTSTWENPLNWSCGTVPNPLTTVLISSGSVVINSNVTIYHLTLGTGAVLTVNSGYTLTVTN